jgi:hypothetical protein
LLDFDFSSVYTPRDAFLPFHKRDDRWASLVCHRRAGKTVACVGELVSRALKTSKLNARYAYIAPFYKQAKEIAWSYLKDMTRTLATDVRESDLRVTLPNGSWITLYGADNPDALRGLYFDGVILDEFGDCRPSLWAEVILPTLADRRGWAVFIGTPKGKNHFWEIHQRSERESNWYSFTLPADKSGLLPLEDLQEMQRQMDESQYAQEFLCDFTAAVKGTYYADIIQKMESKARTNLRNLFDPDLPVQVAADLGYTDSTAFWFWQERPDGIALIDYYENQSQPLQHYIDLLEAKPYDYLAIWLPHDARAKTLQTGRSTIEQMQEVFHCCKITPSLKVQQGIDSARLVLPTCFISEDASAGLEALRSYRRQYNELIKAYRDTPLHDWASNGADAFRYLALVAQRGQSPKRRAEKPPVLTTPKYTLDELHSDREKSPRLSLVRRRI